MALPNRVLPDGTIVSLTARGTMMGNRGGRIHAPDTQSLRQPRWATPQWICCVLQFRGRQRQVWGRSYTELFFCDEVSALAAGHRPCFECRHADAMAYAAALQKTLQLPHRLSAPAIDARLHQERLAGTIKKLHALPVNGLPDGAMFIHEARYYAIRQGQPLQWDFEGYTRAICALPGIVDVLTPPASLAALAGGYQPGWHDSASGL